MKILKRTAILVIMGSLFVGSTSAQEQQITEEQNLVNNSDCALHESPFSLSFELATRYLWRGLEYGDAPVGFPMLSYATGGFCAWGMGAYAIDGSHQEVDLGVTYTYDAVTIGVSDYYYPSAVGTSDNYFDTNNHTTGHWGELYATLAPAKVPLWLTLSCYVYGADKRADGKQAYSSYAEVGYTCSFKNDNAISLTIGANLNKGFYTDYDKGFSVINVALKYSTSFTFGSFKLPVSATYMLNPSKEKSYFGFSTYFGI